MKKLHYLIAGLLLVSFTFQSCDKKEDEEVVEPTNSTPKYSAKISYGSDTYNFTNQNFFSNNWDDRELGGYILEGGLLSGKSLGFIIRFDTNIANVDVVSALMGKKIYFNGYDGPYPTALEVSHELDLNSNSRYSMDDAGSEYFIEITSIKDLGNDALQTYRKYEVRGNFKALMEIDFGTSFEIATGEFFFVWGTDAF